MKNNLFHVIVCAAIANKDGEIFIARRKPEKKLGGFWEFPGGKLELGEDLIPALEREIREELSIQIDSIKLLQAKPFVYDHGAVLILFYSCRHSDGDIKLVDHDEYRWLKPQELKTLKLLPANEDVIKILERLYP